MSKKTGKNNLGNDKDLDDLDLDIDFDDIETDPLDESRSAKSTRYSKKDLVEDGKKFTADLARKTAIKSLPSEYEYGINELSDYASFSKEVLSKNKNKITKELGILNREVKKILPGKLKGISDKFDKFLGTNTNATKTPTIEEERNVFITSSINSIFDKQIEIQNKLRAEDDAKEEVKDKIQLATSVKTQDLLKEISNINNSQLSFSTQIAKEYYKKSLEIQYRSYYIQTDMLETMRNYYKTFTSQFDVISKNTSLPEYVKLQNKEIIQQYTKNKLAEGIYSRLFTKNTYIENIKNNFDKFISEKTSAISDRIREASDALTMVNDAKDLGATPGGLVRDLAIDAGTDVLSNKLSSKFKNKLSNNKYVKTGKNVFNNLINSPQVLFNTISNKINKKLNKISANTDNSLIENLVDNSKSFLNVFKPKALNTSVENESISSATAPAIFDKAVYRSIVDIIPMYLRKILKQNTDMTSMYKIIHNKKLGSYQGEEELHYDFNKRQLDTLGNVKISVNTEIDKLAAKNTKTSLATKITGLAGGNDIIKTKLIKYLDVAGKILPEEQMNTDTLFLNYEQNDKLKEYLNKKGNEDLKLYINNKLNKKLNSKPMIKNDLNYNLKTMNKKGLTSYIRELLNTVFAYKGLPAELHFNNKETEYVIDSFKKFIIRDSGVLTEDDIVKLTPFKYIQEDQLDEHIKTSVTMFGQAVYDISIHDKYEGRSYILNLLGTIDKTLRESDIIDPELFKTIRDYNRELVSVNTDASGNMKISLNQLTDFNNYSEDSIDVTTSFIQVEKTNEIETQQSLLQSLKDKSKNVTDKIKNKSKEITKEISEAKTTDELKKIINKYSDEASSSIKSIASDAKSKIESAYSDISKIVKDNAPIEEVKIAINEKLKIVIEKYNELISAKTEQLSGLQSIKISLINKNEDLTLINSKINIIELELNTLTTVKNHINNIRKIKITSLEEIRTNLNNIFNKIKYEYNKLNNEEETTSPPPGLI